ncbi:MAG TPA: ABC transporter permease [Candidatus Aerophobetes bacterium]|uniref:ABC transporter permease n=1 Tax=Aerophobetes bacterium TaxID=2030807 RepID=A0A662DH86_UNCAE|nr:MAG: ABC transporter permease [Candidatus Aerophobetes bacterium]HDN84707.1 ABC transporter permease [Candidatus Aerophobetes bacterium]
MVQVKYSPSKFIVSKLKSICPRKGTEYFALIGFIIILSIILMAIFAPFIAPYNPIKKVGGILEEPNGRFILGTDGLGRDIFSRIIFGARTAISVTFLAVIISLSFGVLLGLLSGYIGGKFDSIFSLVMDAIYSFPGLILAIVLAAMLGPGILNTAIAIAVIYTPTYFRMVRGLVLSLKESLFVEAARAIGAKDRTIVFKYIFPNVISSVPIVLSLNAADAVLTLAALSFLGLGLPAPTPDWGFDLKAGHAYLASKIWWPSTFPGLMIVILTLGFSLLGEGINEILTPELRR